jgi:hypothetical protein
MMRTAARSRPFAAVLRRAAVVAVVALAAAACVDPDTEPGALETVTGDDAAAQDEAGGAEQRPEPLDPPAGDRDGSDDDGSDDGSDDGTVVGDDGSGDDGSGDAESGDAEDDVGSRPGAGPQNRLPDELLGLPDDCGPEVAAAAADTIAAQLDDFARGDFTAALTHATSAFQAGTDAEAFRTLIEAAYPLLLQDATATLALCTRRGPDTVEVGVEVTTADRVTAPFAYRLRLDDGRWAIDGAVRLTPPPATA